MSNRKLVLLGIIAISMVVWAAFQSGVSNRPRVGPEGPVYLIQGLDPADIDSIVLGADEDSVTLRRGKNHFVVTNKDNCPAITSEINQLITKCLDIRTVELYTDDKANHRDLGVTEEDAQNVVRFFRTDSSFLTGIIIGKAKELGAGSFVRLASSDNVYVTPERPWFSNGAMNYIDQELISVNRDQVESVTVNGPRDVYTLKSSQDSEDIVLENLPAGKTLKADEAKSVFTALANLRFNDVRKDFGDSKLNFDRAYTCRLKDSTVYTLKVAQADEKTYLTCQAEFTDKTPVTKDKSVESEEELKKKEARLLARDRAKDFSARHHGWIYEIAEYEAENLTKDLYELIADEQADTAETAE